MQQKHLFTTVIFLIASLYVVAQNKPDTLAIKKALVDSNSSEGYKALLGRFNTTPRYLYAYEVGIIYYAKLFKKEPDLMESQKKIKELLLQKNLTML